MNQNNKNQRKEKAPCTVAAVQNAKNDPSQDQHENNTKNISSQAFHLFGDLEIADVELEEIEIVMQDLLEQIYMESAPANVVHSEYSKLRFTYYAAMISLILGSISTLKKDLADLIGKAEDLNNQVSQRFL